jgi:hypothetical protein
MTVNLVNGQNWGEVYVMHKRFKLFKRFLNFTAVVLLLLPMASLVCGVFDQGRAAAAAGKISFTPDTISLNEGSSQVVSVQLDSPITAPQTETPSLDVALVSSDPARVSVNPSALHFSANDWSQAKTFTISAVDDGVYNNGESVTISLSATSNAEYYSGVTASLPVALVDIDPVPATTATPAPPRKQTGGSAGTTAPDDQPTPATDAPADTNAASAPRRSPMLVQPSDVPASTTNATVSGTGPLSRLIFSGSKASDKTATVAIIILAILAVPLAAALLLPRRQMMGHALKQRLQRIAYLASGNGLIKLHAAPVAATSSATMLAEVSVATVVSKVAKKPRKASKTAKKAKTTKSGKDAKATKPAKATTPGKTKKPRKAAKTATKAKAPTKSAKSTE